MNDDDKKRLLEWISDFICTESSDQKLFYVKNLGYPTAEHLRVIADELDRLNKEAK